MKNGQAKLYFFIHAVNRQGKRYFRPSAGKFKVCLDNINVADKWVGLDAAGSKDYNCQRGHKRLIVANSKWPMVRDWAAFPSIFSLWPHRRALTLSDNLVDTIDSSQGPQSQRRQNGGTRSANDKAVKDYVEQQKRKDILS
ncbi:hypothetical protein MMC30_005050 [Trapelia coarctata]|nr:hypothetical protein [Trapelia coarctata]